VTSGKLSSLGFLVRFTINCAVSRGSAAKGGILKSNPDYFAECIFPVDR